MRTMRDVWNEEKTARIRKLASSRLPFRLGVGSIGRATRRSNAGTESDFNVESHRHKRKQGGKPVSAPLISPQFWARSFERAISMLKDDIAQLVEEVDLPGAERTIEELKNRIADLLDSLKYETKDDA